MVAVLFDKSQESGWHEDRSDICQRRAVCKPRRVNSMLMTARPTPKEIFTPTRIDLSNRTEHFRPGACSVMFQ